ncbi:hypothetical protein BX257_9076 [Streptomyces sp. 3212.3]|jgi:hypothetical protein|nr:hypothetical protein BX257_9076 [Streptomyces sp. 3212.3]
MEALIREVVVSTRRALPVNWRGATTSMTASVAGCGYAITR